MKLLRWDGCFTVTLAPWESISHLYPVPYYYQTLCDRKRNITGSTNLAYSEKINLQVPVRLSFQGLSLFLGKEKLAKCTYFATGRYFIDPPLIFATQKLIISLQHIMLCISCLAKVCEYSALPNAMKNPLLIVKVILRRWSIKTLILRDLRR